MIEPTAGEPKAGRDVLRFEIRQLFEDLLLSESSGKQVQNIDHPNPHPTDAAPPSALRKLASIRSTSSAMMWNFSDARSHCTLPLLGCDLLDPGHIQWLCRSALAYRFSERDIALARTRI